MEGFLPANSLGVSLRVLNERVTYQESHFQLNIGCALVSILKNEVVGGLTSKDIV